MMIKNWHLVSFRCVSNRRPVVVIALILLVWVWKLNIWSKSISGLVTVHSTIVLLLVLILILIELLLRSSVYLSIIDVSIWKCWMISWRERFMILIMSKIILLLTIKLLLSDLVKWACSVLLTMMSFIMMLLIYILKIMWTSIRRLILRIRALHSLRVSTWDLSLLILPIIRRLKYVTISFQRFLVIWIWVNPWFLWI